MTVRLQAATKCYIGDSTDTKPVPGLQSDGTTTPTAAVPWGSTFYEADTRARYVFDGAVWRPDAADEKAADSSGEILRELRAIRTGVELYLALEKGVNIDLLTETVTEVN